MNTDIIGKAISLLAKRYNIPEEQVAKLFKTKIEALRSQGRLDLATFGLKESCTLEKFDHSQHDVPTLMERIEIDEHGTRTITKEETT